MEKKIIRNVYLMMMINAPFLEESLDIAYTHTHTHTHTHSQYIYV